MNLNKIDENLGHSIVSGQYDLKNQNVIRNIARKVGQAMTGGAKVRTERGTRELLEEGRTAKPAGKEDELLRAMEEDPAQPQSAEQDADAVDGEFEPAGVSYKQAQDAVDEATEEPDDFGLPDRGAKTAEEYIPEVAKKTAERLQNRTWQRNINLDYIDNAEQIGAFLETNADMIPTAERQSFDEVQAAVDAGEATKILKDVLTEKPAALSATQLLAGRQVLVSMGADLEQRAQKIVAGEATQEDILGFEKVQGQMVMIQEYMQGKIRESARALNSMKIVAQTVNSGNIAQMARAADGDSRAVTEMAAHVLDLKKAGKNTGEVIEEMSRMSKIKGSLQAIVNYRNAAILTGFKTQGVNFISNSVYGAVSSMFVRPLAGGIGAVRSRITGNQDRIYVEEGLAEASALLEGFGDALRMAVKVWMDGSFKNRGEYISSFGGRKIDEAVDTSPLMGTAFSRLGGDRGERVARMTGAPQALDMGQRGVEAISYGLLTAGDEFFKSIAYRKSLYAQAARMAARDGVDGFGERANEYLNNVTKEMHDEAIAYAEQQTFTNPDVTPGLKLVADTIIKLGQMVPPMRLIFPFVRTPTSLFDRSIKMSPLAVLQKDFYDRVSQGGAEADMALAEMGFGTALASMFYFLYQSNLITGQGPGWEDQGKRNQRETLMATGWQSNSFRLPDGTYVSYARGMEPMSIPLVGIANYMDKIAYAQEESDAMDLFAGASLAMAAHFKDNTYMQGMADLVNLMTGRVNYKSYAAQTAASFVPSLARDIRSIEKGLEGEEQFPYVPKSHNFWEMLTQELARRTPGTEDMAIRRYWDGTPIVAGGGEALYMYNSLSPVRMSKVMGSGEREMDYANERLVANGIGVSEPNSEIGIESNTGIKVDLLELNSGAKLYDKMLEIVGETRRETVEAAIDSRGFDDLDSGPGSNQAAVLEKALARGHRVGKARFLKWLMEEDLDPDVYGPEAELLNPQNLEKLVQYQMRGEATPEETQMLLESGMKGIPSREELYVPKI